MEAFRQYLAAHHGFFTRGQARKFGLSDRQIEWRCSTGEYLRVGSRLFRLATAPRNWESQARAAALEARGLVSHTSALRVWQVDGHLQERDLHVAVAGSRRPQATMAVVHRASQPPTGLLVDGIPVTSHIEPSSYRP